MIAIALIAVLLGQDDPRLSAQAEATVDLYECAIANARRLEPSGEDLSSVASSAVVLCNPQRDRVSSLTEDWLRHSPNQWEDFQVVALTNHFTDEAVEEARSRALAEAMLLRAARAD